MAQIINIEGNQVGRISSSGWTNEERLRREGKEGSRAQTEGALSRTRGVHSFPGRGPYFTTVVTLRERFVQWQARQILLDDTPCAESNA